MSSIRDLTSDQLRHIQMNIDPQDGKVKVWDLQKRQYKKLFPVDVMEHVRAGIAVIPDMNFDPNKLEESKETKSEPGEVKPNEPQESLTSSGSSTSSVENMLREQAKKSKT